MEFISRFIFYFFNISKERKRGLQLSKDKKQISLYQYRPFQKKKKAG